MTTFHQTLYPSPALQPYILFYSYIELPAGTACQVIPATSLVMGLYSNGLMTRTPDTAYQPIRYHFFGFQDVCRTFYAPQPSRMMTIHFNDLHSEAFLRLPLRDVFNTTLSLDNCFSPQRLLELEERFLTTVTPQQALHEVEAFLLTHLAPVTRDPLLARAFHYLRQSNGRISMVALADNLHCSQSLMEKRFRNGLGLTAKKLASLIRFNATVYHHAPEMPLTEKAYSSGYFDQAHFIREVKTYTGQSPRQLFRDLKPLGDFRVFGLHQHP